MKDRKATGVDEIPTEYNNNNNNGYLIKHLILNSSKCFTLYLIWTTTKRDNTCTIHNTCKWYIQKNGTYKNKANNINTEHIITQENNEQIKETFKCYSVLFQAC